MELSSTNHASRTSTALYYYNVDAILSELVRPPTPKLGKLARPRLVKPEPIRPQQLMTVVTNSNVMTPYLLDDRNEGARNPDPVMVTDEDDDNSIGSIDKEDSYSHNNKDMDVQQQQPSNESNTKRSRDDEDIMYYKVNHMQSLKNTTTTTPTATANIVTPNHVQYYSTKQNATHTKQHAPVSAPYYQEPQYIVYKNYDSNNSTGSHHHHQNHTNRNMYEVVYNATTMMTTATSNGTNNINNSNNNNDDTWSTMTPNTSVSYTIVKPIALRPMDVIQQMYDENHDNSNNNMDHSMFQNHTSLYVNDEDDKNKNSSMQVCG
jgi:hypothetical protein